MDEKIEDTLAAIAGAISMEIENHLETEVAFSNIGEVTYGTLQDDEAIRPGRYEDVEHFASKVADMALADVREAVERVAREMLHELMEPR